jgi:DNA-binding NtrC family response regulator
MTAPRVLIVDDEPDVLNVCARTLRKQNFEVITASDARTAKILLRAQAIDLFITDIRMPVEDGISLLHAVHDTDPDLPLMIITGYPDYLPSVYAALNLNVKSFLVKPFTPSQLLSEVKRSLGLQTKKTTEEQESERNELVSAIVEELRQHKIPILEGAIQRDPVNGQVVLVPPGSASAVPIVEFLTSYTHSEQIYLIVLPHTPHT